MFKVTNFRLRLIFWVSFYLLLVTIPLFLAQYDHDLPWRGFSMEFGVGMGLVGFSMMVFQFLLTGEFHQIAPRFGSDAVLQFHRYAGIIAYGFVLGHIITVILTNPEYAYYFHPADNAPRALALTIALLSLTTVIVTSLWRNLFRLSYEWWLFIHGSLSALVVFIGLVHLIQVGHYISTFWKQATWGAMATFSMGMLVYLRVVAPYRTAKQPYFVRRVKKESDDVFTLEVEAHLHEGMNFEAGQYAKLFLEKKILTYQQNPFSISSSENSPKQLSFSIKELGDFSKKIRHLSEGTRIYLTGPYGSFTLLDESSPVMFVVGGIGITPVMSMLRTLREKRSQRKLVLIYGNETKSDVVFKDELDSLEKELKLRVIHVMDELPEGWTGEEGLVDEALLERYRIPDEGTLFYVCGPPPLMDIAEMTFLDWGIPARRIHSERFSIV